MNEAIRPYSPFDFPGTTSDPEVRAPDRSMPTSTKRAESEADDMLLSAVAGGRDTNDYLSPGAASTAGQRDDDVSIAGKELHAKTTQQLRQTGDEWVKGARSSVRNNPLTSIAAAVALGAVIARIAR